MTGIDTLRENIRGAVITVAAEEYDRARAVYNAMIDRRPELIVQCANVGDVITALRHARDNGLDVAVRGGGHSVPGFGTCEGGLVIDLSAMRGVRVDPTTRTARVEGGATWGDFDAATHAFGLATTGGIVSTTGVSGLTLGGGIGYLARAFGLSCDNLISADVVTADGRFLVASEKENADLFWALRGGGGNFGVVTSLEFRLHPVADIYGGPLFFELDDAGDVLRFYREFIAEAPDEFGGFPAFQIAPPLPFIPEDRHGDPLLAFIGCWAGPIERGEEVFAPLRDVATPVAEHLGPMPYPALNNAFDALVPPGLQHYWKAVFSTDLPDAVVEAHLRHGPRVPVVNSTVHIYPINGACHRVPPGATAFAHRDASFATVIAGMWPDPADNEANIAWVREYYNAIAPHSQRGGYINFMAADDQDRVEANYGDSYRRLAQIKRTYDPDNVFHFNQNIQPAI